MSFWSIINPLKPIGIKDSDAVLDFPIDYTQWLSDINDGYLNHSIINVTGGIVCQNSIYNNGIITAWISGGNLGEIASFTIRINTIGISTPIGRIDDRTFYLKIINR